MTVREKESKDLINILRNIDSKLDILIILQKAQMPKPKIGEEEHKILKLCDRRHTIDEMVEKTGKAEGTIKATLSHLRDKALILTVKTKDKTVYERI